LEGAIMYYKPKTVVELKIFMAKSTVGIFQAANTVNIKLNYYGFDRFTHVFNNISHITETPIDKLFLNYPKLDTAVHNVIPYSNTHNINFVIFDADKSIEYLKINSIMVDLVYIDFCKDPIKLDQLIRAYLLYNPNIIIIGDDLAANKKLLKVIGKYDAKVFNAEAYLIYKKQDKNINNTFPKGVSINTYPKLNFTNEEKSKIDKNYLEYLNACS
jgi:hypothetical protein